MSAAKSGKQKAQAPLADIFVSSFGWKIRCRCCGYSTNTEAWNSEGFRLAAKSFYDHLASDEGIDRHMQFSEGGGAA
jgi:hypothetical protein